MSEPLLILNPKIEDYSKRYIWGTERDAFILFAQLISYRIPVEGFISSNEDEIGMVLLNKPVISIDMIEDKEDALIIADSKNSSGITDIEIVTDVFAFSESFAAEKVVIYGAGEVGESMVPIFSAKGIQIVYFLDRDKSGQQLCGIPIYHPQKIKGMDDDTVIIEAGRFWKEMEDAVRSVKPGIQTFYVDWLTVMNEKMWIRTKDYHFLVLRTMCMFTEFFRSISDRKIIVLCDHVENARGCKEVLECFGYKNLSVMAVNESELCEDVPLLEEILYEKNYVLLICEILTQKNHKIVERIEELGVSYDDWVSIYSAVPYRRRECMLDLNLDYTYKMNYIPGLYLHGKEKETDVKIVTLGGSTTDEEFCSVSSWPQILFEKYCGENITLYNGGIAGYVSSQELIKLARDILYLKPDIIVVFDGFNDTGDFFPFLYGVFDYYKEDIYEHRVFEYCKGVMDIFSGIETKDVVERWLKNIESMYAIAQLHNIRFFSFIQPMLGSQKIHNKHGLAHQKTFIAMTDRKEVNNMKLFRKQGKEIEKTHPYIHDLSHIFDEKDVYLDQCHVWESGNEIIADSIWKIIEPSVNEILERKINSK